MALIKCPECGKENVSSTAVSCPECGYGIKEHIEKIILEKKMQDIPMPQKPKKRYMSIKDWFFTSIWGIIGVILMCIGIETDAVLFALICGGIGIGYSCDIYYKAVVVPYKRDLDKYYLAMHDIEKYKMQQIIPSENKLICPKCGSEKIADGTRGWTFITGFLMSNNFRYICRSCGNKWKTGSLKEALQRLNSHYWD